MAFACVLGGCLFQALVDFEPTAAMQAIINHVATELPAQIPRAREPSLRLPALICPTVDIGCSPAQWADLLTRWSRFGSGCNIPAPQLTTQATACFSEELIGTADKAIHDIGSLSVADLLSQVKTVAVLPVATGILPAMAHSAKQGSGERSQTYAAKVRGLTTDCDYMLPCPHAVAPAQACTTAGANCTGVDCTLEGHSPLKHL